MKLAVISSGYHGELHPVYPALGDLHLKMNSLQAEYHLTLLKTVNRLENMEIIQYVLCEESVSNRSQTAGFHQDIGDSCNVLLSSKCQSEVSISGKDRVCT